MTANEGRARMNLPAMGGDADRLVTPLNVLVGGQASPRDSAPPKAKARELDTHQPELRERHEQKWAELLGHHYRRQEAAIVSRVPAVAGKTDLGDGVWWDDERWDGELYEDLLRLNVLTAGEWATMFAGRLEAEVSQERMLGWLQEHSRVQASYINGQTRDQVEQALREPDPLEAVKGVFALALSVWAVRQAVSAVTAAASFGAHEAASAAALRTKTWRVNSSNPRDAHLAMDGETVGIRDRFSNGMRWPGDPAGGAENNANCNCSVEFGR